MSDITEELNAAAVIAQFEAGDGSTDRSLTKDQAERMEAASAVIEQYVTTAASGVAQWNFVVTRQQMIDRVQNGLIENEGRTVDPERLADTIGEKLASVCYGGWKNGSRVDSTDRIGFAVSMDVFDIAPDPDADDNDAGAAEAAEFYRKATLPRVIFVSTTPGSHAYTRGERVWAILHLPTARYYTDRKTGEIRCAATTDAPDQFAGVVATFGSYAAGKAAQRELYQAVRTFKAVRDELDAQAGPDSQYLDDPVRTQGTQRDLKPAFQRGPQAPALI